MESRLQAGETWLYPLTLEMFRAISVRNTEPAKAGTPYAVPTLAGSLRYALTHRLVSLDELDRFAHMCQAEGYAPSF